MLYLLADVWRKPSCTTGNAVGNAVVVDILVRAADLCEPHEVVPPIHRESGAEVNFGSQIKLCNRAEIDLSAFIRRRDEAGCIGRN